MPYSPPSKGQSFGPAPRCGICICCLMGLDCEGWDLTRLPGVTVEPYDVASAEAREGRRGLLDSGPLRPEGVARFGFAGEPPDGWASEERRSLASARLTAEIEDGEPEMSRIPWGVLILFLVLIALITSCIFGAVWFLSN